MTKECSKQLLQSFLFGVSTFLFGIDRDKTYKCRKVIELPVRHCGLSLTNKLTSQPTTNEKIDIFQYSLLPSYLARSTWSISLHSSHNVEARLRQTAGVV